jgi:hypothetical protein
MHMSMGPTDVLMETFALGLMLPLLSCYTESHVLFPSDTVYSKTAVISQGHCHFFVI